MLRVLGLLLLVSGIVTGLLLVVASMSRMALCTPIYSSMENYRPFEENGKTLVFVYSNLGLQLMKLEGIRYTLKFSLPAHVELLCPQAVPANASQMLQPVVGLGDVEKAELFLLNPADATLISTVISDPSISPSHALALARKRAVISINLTGRWLLDSGLDLEGGSYQGLLVVTIRASGHSVNCTGYVSLARPLVFQAKVTVCRTLSPTANQIARSLLVLTLGFVLLSYDLWRSGEKPRWLSRASYTLRRAVALVTRRKPVEGASQH